MQKKQTKRSLPPAALILRIGLPVILIELCLFTSMLCRDMVRDITFALHRYPPMLEYIMMSLTLLIIGAFLFDYIDRKNKGS